MAKKSNKPYWEMNAVELAAATKEFDREFVADEFGRPTPMAREQVRRARIKVGRPMVGEGAKRVLVTIERGLLREADALARASKKSRSELVAAGLRAVLTKRRRHAG